MHGVTYAALLVVGCASAACASSATLAPQITNAMDQQHLPKVLACWEHEFEAAGFKGRYEARVDFSVASSTGTISGARVRDLEPTDEIDAANGVEHGARLARCVEQALNQSSLAPGGFTPAIDTRVVGLPIVFADASAAVREAASERVKHVLIGPRADRCSGLYTYEPPRPAAVIQGALDDASRQTTRHANSDKDAYARALQRCYDLALELREMLSIESRRNGLPLKSRERFYAALDRASERAQEIGDKIGCTIPELKH